MDAEFNRQVVINNIIALIQSRGIRMGEAEKQLGVSAGYLSRLSKKENESALSAEFVWKAAQYLDVSVDSLIRNRIGEEEQAVTYMRKFINRLIKRTNTGDLIWKAVPVEEINGMLMEEATMQFPVIPISNVSFPKQSPTESQDIFLRDNAIGWWGHNKVASCIYGGVMVIPQDTVYHTSLSDSGDELYLTLYYVETEGGHEEFFELMLVNTDKYNSYIDSQCGEIEFRQYLGKYELPFFAQEICNTYGNGWQPISDNMQELYKTVSAHEKDIVISDTVKSVIDAYMRESEDLPF